MKLYKYNIPDIYNEIPFPEGYFEAPNPFAAQDKNAGGYDLFMALDYAALEHKEFARLCLKEMNMFKINPDGKMDCPEAFAEYLERKYEKEADNDQREFIRFCSLRYIRKLPFSAEYIDKILPQWAQGNIYYDFARLESYTKKNKILLDDIDTSVTESLRTDECGRLLK